MKNKTLALLILALAPASAAIAQVVPAAPALAPPQSAAPQYAVPQQQPAYRPALAPPAGNRASGAPATAAPMTADQAANAYFTNPNPTLTPQEKAGIEIGRRWQQDAALGMKPVPGADGSIRYLFGASEPTIVCAVLQVCDVALQAGEQVNSINLGDTARWTVEPAITGSGDQEVQHLIIKPQDVGLDTSLVVTTDRRTYHFRLLSHRTDYMPFVSFSYPEDAMAKWAAIHKAEIKDKTENTIPSTGEYLGDLHFNYTIEGNASWKPTRVYNDGTKTIIEMPTAMAQQDAPTLLVVRKVGNSYKNSDQEMVNYRVQSNRYIVDNVFDRAILITGVGHDQAKVVITRGN